MHIPKNLKKIRKVNITPQQLFNFEEEIKKFMRKVKLKHPYIYQEEMKKT